MSTDKKMIPIPIAEFISGGAIPVNVYIRLSNEKFVMIAKEGSKTSLQQMRTFEKQTVDTLYVEEEQYHRLVAQNLTIADIILTREDISHSKKADFLVKSSASVMKQVEVFGFNRENFENAKMMAAQTTKLVEAKPELFHLLNSVAKISDEILSHSVAVSAVATMMGKTIGWTVKSTFEKVALGALLHDVGLRQINPELLKKQRAFFTYDDNVEYESHTFKGMEILRTISQVPDDVVIIAYEHHENAIGQGYPRKLRDLRLSPLSKVVIVADAFVELTLPSSTNPKPKTPEEALEYMDRVLGQPFNKDAFAALRHMVRSSTPGVKPSSDDDSSAA